MKRAVSVAANCGLKLLVVSVCFLLLAGCSPKEDGQKKVTGVAVDPPSVTITEGEMLSLKVDVTPQDAHWLYAEWSSSDETVAQINKVGTLKAIKEGSATITATVDGVQGTCSVTVVINQTPVSGISLSAESLTIGKGATETLTATIEPADAANKNVIWSSSDSKIATVDGGVVTGVGGGECDIVARTEDGGFEAVCHVKVSSIPVEALEFSNGSSFTLLADAGETYTLIVTYTPANTSDRDLEWSSSDASLATVEVTEEGQAIVTFASGNTGPVTITAGAGNPQRTASQQFFVQGAGPLVNMPGGIFYAGRKALWSLNTAAYGDASNIKWEASGKSLTGTEASFAPIEGGENSVVVSADYAGTPIRFEVNYEAEEWLINEALDGANPRNTYPVFNKECTRAYFITRGARRLYEIDLEEGSVSMMFNLNDGKNDNGGDIAVNPVSGDIYCSNQQHIFCISASGRQKWEIPVPTCTSASSIAGCGPALSNDCSVVFIPAADKRLIAVNAASGAVLDEYPVETTHIQMAVYGNNQIVLASSKKDGVEGIRFLSFAGDKFSEVKVMDCPSGDLSDITSPAINSSQTKCWFTCNRGVMVEVDLNAKTATSVKVADGYVWSPCLTADQNWMFFASQDKSLVNRKDPSAFSASTAVVYTNGNDSFLNFTHVACDTEGNVYFFVKEDGAGNNAFYRLNASRNWQPEIIASIGKQNNDPQAFFNFGGGYLIGGGGQNVNNRLLVRCIDAERAKSWSGAGGDVCATKNANLVYGD
ncbi:MAG: Ig domain-containing protein [Bacteroidales bacterium]|nr:Ig domain-containing protein [Bacteroidales bacterium]